MLTGLGSSALDFLVPDSPSGLMVWGLPPSQESPSSWLAPPQHLSKSNPRVSDKGTAHGQNQSENPTYIPEPLNVRGGNRQMECVTLCLERDSVWPSSAFLLGRESKG